MAHAQKPDFVFRPSRRVHLNRSGASVQWTTGSRVVRISGSNAGYTMFRGSVKSTGYPPHSPVSPSIPLPCVTVCHHISTGLYNCGSPLHVNLKITILRKVSDTLQKTENHDLTKVSDTLQKPENHDVTESQRQFAET
jgi:hypothetical protein